MVSWSFSITTSNSSLAVCPFEPLCFKTSPSTLCLVTILMYQLSHVVYAHCLHTSLLRHLWSRIPPGFRLSVSLQWRLGYSNSPGSPTPCPRRGPHYPLQRLSQATSVVDITIKTKIHCGFLYYSDDQERVGLHTLHYWIKGGSSCPRTVSQMGKVVVTFRFVTLISCRVICTYMSPLSLSAVSSHVNCTITHS